MKDGKFENQKEIYEALIAGKTITKDAHILCLIDGILHDKRFGRLINHSFFDPSRWSIYEEPKKTEKHYRWLCQIGDGGYFINDYYFKDRPNNGVKRLDNDFITVDEDGNLVEEA